MIYFTADLHLGHRHALESMARPFQSVEEMNIALIKNINDRVSRKDILYILGDLAFRISRSKANELISEIRCKKILIKGNHDLKYNLELFEGMYDFLELKNQRVPVSLMHYPMLSWPKSHYGSVQLHGHSHSKENVFNGVRRYDVGVDANNMLPVSLEEVYKFFSI